MSSCPLPPSGPLATTMNPSPAVSRLPMAAPSPGKHFTRDSGAEASTAAVNSYARHRDSLQVPGSAAMRATGGIS
ncbi:hypothetical protein DFH06DRAFT_1472043 [Mycena polygramma]|nr:hypothetical protein DFH06DRAFT_1472043 [Mycena polygramma]